MNPKISVVTVCYNTVQEIESTILSVINQTYDNIEYIIVDGGSKDGTIDIIKKYSNKITKWISEPDKGIYNAMNKGAKLSSGDYIAYLNAGDIYYSNEIIKKIVENIKEDKDLIYGDIIYNKRLKPQLQKAKDLSWFNKNRCPIFHPSTLVKRDIMINEPFDENLRMVSDYKFFKKLYNEGKHFFYLNFPFVIFENNGISSTNPIALYKEGYSVDHNNGSIYFTFRFYKLLFKQLIKRIVYKK